MDAWDKPVQAWLEYTQMRNLRPEHTIANYRQVATGFKTWYEQSYDLLPTVRGVTDLAVSEYRRHLMNRGRKPGTINMHLRVLRIFFRWCKRRGLLEHDPTEVVRRVPYEERKPQALPAKVMNALLREFKLRGNMRYYVMVLLMHDAGLRVSEVIMVRKRDIAFDGHGRVKVVGKGMKPRTVPLTARLKGHLETYVEPLDPDDLLFPGVKDGQPLTRRAVGSTLAAYARRADVPHINPHAFRHTFCKRLIDSGADPRRVAKLAGHSSITTTMQYAEPTEDDLAETIALLDV